MTDGPNWLNGRNLPLATRFVSSMQGTLGIGGNLSEWTTEELAEAAEWIATYKTIRETVQFGRQYRLKADRVTTSLMQYTSNDQTVILAVAPMRKHGIGHYRFRLAGLEETTLYQVEDRQLSGAYLMQQGLTWNYTNDYEARCLRIQPVHRSIPTSESKEPIV